MNRLVWNQMTISQLLFLLIGSSYCNSESPTLLCYLRYCVTSSLLSLFSYLFGCQVLFMLFQDSGRHISLVLAPTWVKTTRRKQRRRSNWTKCWFNCCWGKLWGAASYSTAQRSWLCTISAKGSSSMEHDQNITCHISNNTLYCLHKHGFKLMTASLEKWCWMHLC